MAQRLLVGVERDFIRDLKNEISEKVEMGADYFVAPLFRPPQQSLVNGSNDVQLGSPVHSDRELEIREWITNIVGRVSEWIDLNSPDAEHRALSVQALQQETSWMGHLSLQAIVLPTPRLNCTNYARAVMQVFTGYQQFYIRIPLIPPLPVDFTNEDTMLQEICQDGWQLWDNLRQHFGDFNRYFAALELSAECESIASDALGEAFVSRWCAEPVKLIILPTSLFLENSAGYPVLTKRIQRILSVLLPHCNQVLLTGESRREGGSYLHYGQYLRYLVAQNQAQLSGAARHVQGYEDTLQAPLQPLMDNLEAQTYETFERDPMKYIGYEEAITKAITVLLKKRTMERTSAVSARSVHASSQMDTSEGSVTASAAKDGHAQDGDGCSDSPITLVLTVVGAGRGPLVAAALSASATTGVPVRVYAVEKNSNAVYTLRSRAQTECWHNVTIVSTDMRDWQPAELCDIMISELLGSFGDNELSPECLDGAQKCLKSDGISIPQSYTSFIAPIATSKLWNMAKGFNSSNSTIADGLNTAYVVRFHSAYQFAEATPLFTFTHPNRPPAGKKIDNTRYGEASFVSQVDMVLHGLAGYFETVLFTPPPADAETAHANSDNGGAGASLPQAALPPGLNHSAPVSPPYLPPPPPGMPAIITTPVAGTTASTTASASASVVLSTVPQTHTVDMYSWFPLFIPLSQPVRVRAGETITAHVWRCADAKKVWYEWCLSSPQRTPVQNSGGKSYSVGL